MLFLSDVVVEEFYVLIKGAAQCEWSKNEGETTYSARDVLLETKISLFQSGILTSGVHRYEFSTVLSTALLSSVEGKHGSIKYEIEAKLDISWIFMGEIKKPFKVLRTEDLSGRPELIAKVEREEAEAFCCCWLLLCCLCCCFNEYCTVTLTLPKSGFVPEEMLEFTVSINNLSHVDIASLRATIKKVITYNSDIPAVKSKTSTEDVIEMTIRGITGKRKSSHTSKIQIPKDVIPTNSHCSRILQVSYELMIEAIAEGCHVNVEVKTPIMIGSCPNVIAAQSRFVAYELPKNFSSELPPSFDEAMRFCEKPTDIGWRNDIDLYIAPSAPLMSDQ